MTPSQTIKQLFRAAKADAPKFMSLKSFAKSLKGDTQKVAEDWQANKAGAIDKVAKQEREKNKGGLLNEMRLASKSPKSKSSNAKKS